MFVVVSPFVQSIPWHAGKAGALLYRVTKSIHEVVFLEVVFLYCCYCIGGVVALFGHRPCLPWLLIGMVELQGSTVAFVAYWKQWASAHACGGHQLTVDVHSLLSIVVGLFLVDGVRQW